MADNPRPHIEALKRVLKFAKDSAMVVAPLYEDVTCDDILEAVQTLEKLVDGLAKKTKAEVASEALQLVRANHMGVWVVCDVGEIEERLVESLFTDDCDEDSARRLWKWHKLRVLVSQDWLGDAVAEHFESSSSETTWEAFSEFRDDAPDDLFKQACDLGLLPEGLVEPDFEGLANDPVVLEELLDAIKAAPVA